MKHIRLNSPTWNLVEGTIGLDEPREDVPAAGQAVEHPSHNACRDPNRKDCDHLVPSAAQHDLLCFERYEGCEPRGHLEQGLDVPPKLPVNLHCLACHLESGVCL